MVPLDADASQWVSSLIHASGTLQMVPLCVEMGLFFLLLNT